MSQAPAPRATPRWSVAMVAPFAKRLFVPLETKVHAVSASRAAPGAANPRVCVGPPFDASAWKALTSLEIAPGQVASPMLKLAVAVAPASMKQEARNAFPVATTVPPGLA